ncbi:hypothetical protein ACIQUF_17780 [Pseudomonas sp. NPDC090233]|uniref:hypothetical protein n=1 Tax=Pseudomonas sp. NPDC090233 TaxID=3364479 RepID=UPI00383B86CB
MVEPVRVGWHMRYWLIRMSARDSLARGLARCLAWISRLLPVGGLFRALPALQQRLPAAWRGKDYSLCRQNLEALGYARPQARALACRYGALQLQRAVHERLYPRSQPQALRAWVNSIPEVDPQGWPPGSRPALYMLLHTGEYWMAVASVMAREAAPTRFVIPIWNFADAFTQASLRQLEGLGHRVEVLDAAHPTTALTMARALKRGARVILFCDLPVGLGALRFGEPLPGRLFNRSAQFVKGPLFLAAKLKCDALLVGHRAVLGGKGEVRILTRVRAAPLEVMQKGWMAALERFIGAAPEQWLYLPRLEAFYHRQRATAEQRGPTGLGGRR